MPTTKSSPSSSVPALTLQAFKLTTQDTEILENVARKLSERSGRAPSRSAALRVLIRLAETFDDAALDRLTEILAEEFTAGVHWGRDRQKPPV